MNMSIQKLFEHGSQLNMPPEYLRCSNLPEMATTSIQGGLKAYFSTYQTSGVSPVLPSEKRENSASFRSTESSPDYLEAYSETILHLHFGIELLIKELLRQKHPLLASTCLPKSAVLLCRILHNEPSSFEDEQTLKSVQFKEAIERVLELKEANFLADNLSIISSNKKLLNNLNTLRNRIIHRGLFVMDYSAFDLLMSAHLLPFLLKFLALPQFANSKCIEEMSSLRERWRYKRLHCGIDPLNEIIKIKGDSKISRRKLGFLKELGRAAYQNPLDESNERSDFGFSDEQIRLRAKQYADREMENLNYHAMVGANKILRCPVCEEITLVRYNDGDGNDAEVKCMCCTFNVQRSLGNAKDYGIEIEDFWG